MKFIELREILSEEEIRAAFRIYKSDPSGMGARKIAKEIIEPKIEEINARLGQDNDPLYLAYACEYAFTQTDFLPMN